MYNLLSAGFSRLLMNRAFWGSVVFIACAEGICCMFMLRGGPIPMDVVLFMSLQCIGILTAIFFSLFLGTEYSDGTIRNKLIAGHKRSKVYFAGFITGIAAITIIYLTEILTGSIIGMIFYDSPQHSVSQMILAGGIGWLACVSFVSVFTLIGMLSSSKALTAIICMLTAFVSLFSGLYTLQSLSKPGLTGVKKEIYQVLFEINPSGHILQTMMIDIDSPWKLVLYSFILIVFLSAAGLYFFERKDLK